MANWSQNGRYEGQEPPNVISSYISGGQVVSCFVPYGVGVTLKMSRSGPQGVTLIPPTPPGAPPTSQLRQVSSSGSGNSWGSFGGASMTTPQRSQETQSSFGTNSSAFMNHTLGGGYAWTSSSQSTTPVPETPPSGNQFSSLQSSDWDHRYSSSSTSGTSGPLLTSTMLHTPPPFAPRPQFGAPPPGPSKRPQSSLSRASTLALSPIPPSGSEPFPLRPSPLGDSSFSGIERASPGSNRSFSSFSGIEIASPGSNLSFGGLLSPMGQQFQPSPPVPSSQVSSPGSSSSWTTLECSMPPFPAGGSEAEKNAWFNEYHRRAEESRR